MEHPDRKKCICQGRGKYFVRTSAAPVYIKQGEREIWAIDPRTINETEVFCSLYGVSDADSVQGRLMVIYVAPSF